MRVEILQGWINYAKWYCGYKLIGECKDVWSLICADAAHQQPVLPMPTQPLPPDVNDKKFTGRTLEEAAAASEALSKAMHSYSISVTTYKLDLEAWKEQQGRVRTARTLLLASINPAIFSSVRQHETPKDIMDAIKALCKINDGRALACQYEQIDSMESTDFDNVTDLISTLKTCQQDIIALKGTHDDDHIISKVVSLLPGTYDDFIISWEMLTRSSTLVCDMPTLHRQLLRQENRKVKNKAKKNDSTK